MRKISFFTRNTPKHCRVAALASCSVEHAEWRGARAFTIESTSFVNPPHESSHLVGFQCFAWYAEGLSSLFSLSPPLEFILEYPPTALWELSRKWDECRGSPSFIRQSAKRRWKGKNCARERETGTPVMAMFPARSPFIGWLGRRGCGDAGRLFHDLFIQFSSEIRWRDSFYIQFRGLQ